MPFEPDRYTDLVSEMYALVAEQAPLREVTNQVTDLIGEGDSVVHGPWTTSECQSVLLPWLAAGWLELIADADPPASWNLGTGEWQARADREGEYHVLAREDAYGLLAESGRWQSPPADVAVMLCSSEEGSRHAFAEWSALVAPK